MAKFGFLSKALVLLASWNLVAPAPLLLAAPPSSPRPGQIIRDVVLGEGGTLRGQLRTQQGQSISDRLVSVKKANGATITTRTDQQGNFAISGLRGGLYRIATRDTAVACRLWTPQTSPPAAIQAVLLVDDSQLVQRGQRPIGDIITNPLVIGLAIAAAIAIPVALNNSKSDKRSGS